MTAVLMECELYSCCDWLGGAAGEEPSNGLAFPHPEAGDDKGGEENETCWDGVLGDVFERTVDVADDWDAEDEVNPAED